MNTLHGMESKGIGEEMYALIKELYPLCRSLTGDGVRETLKIIKSHIPIEIKKVPTGTKVFDWAVPKEWNIRDAYIKNSKGEKIVDFRRLNLHILNYSSPINKRMSLKELQEHLFTLPDHPDWIPYLTTYYKENWGFCLTHNQFRQLKEDTYDVVIDSSLNDGCLTYGELYVRGETDEEILFSCYVCHPSMCNDNLSGVAVWTFLAKSIKDMKLKHSYRFLFIPETIGSITWLSLNERNVQKIKGGLVATCLGDRGKSTYKKSRIGNALIDKVMEKVLLDSGSEYKIIDFNPASGSDERQFCSPGFNLPIGSLMRTPYGHFPEYHTSADNLEFTHPESLKDSFVKYLKAIFILEHDAIYTSLNQKCEPQLGKRGLYRLVGAQKENSIDEKAVLWILNLSDGKNSLLDISMRSGLGFEQVAYAADLLRKEGLLRRA